MGGAITEIIAYICSREHFGGKIVKNLYRPMKLRNLTTILLILTAVAASASGWHPDVLGKGFEMRHVEQPDDYSGAVRCTVVRHKSDCSEGAGVLYVHGFNDYFFQKEMAEEFAAHCYDFYAVDLRKYGRSILPGQRKFELRDISEYFADIDSAIVQMKADGIRDIILAGHSTGGLTTAAYMAKCPDPAIKALILNSPFLDWNQSKFEEKFLIPAVRTFSPLMKRLNIPQGDSDAYARSLLKSLGGEWLYDTDWKLTVSPPVEASWIAAIDAAHDIVQNDPGIAVPILLMHSDRSVKKGDPADAYNRADAVLDVEDISRYGRRLGLSVTEISVNGGLHDLVLSAPKVRSALYAYLFDWLSKTVPARFSRASR